MDAPVSTREAPARVDDDRTLDQPVPLGAEERRRATAYWRAANHLSVGQICLYDNFPLREPLTMAHVFACEKAPLSSPGGMSRAVSAAVLETARCPAVEPSRAVVVENATVGVEAGRAGRFGSVIDLDRGESRRRCAKLALTAW